MKRLVDFFLRQSHFLILFYTGFLSYDAYQTFEFDLQNITDQIGLVENAVRNERRKNIEAEQFSKNLENSRLKIEELKKQIDDVQKQLPNIISDTDVLDLFSREASGLNIKNVVLKPLGEEEKDFYFSKKYSLKGQGTFLQFLIFYEKIGSQDRIYNISSLSIKKEDKNLSKGRFQILNFDTVMEAFRYNPSKAQSLEMPIETKPATKTRGKKV